MLLSDFSGLELNEDYVSINHTFGFGSQYDLCTINLNFSTQEFLNILKIKNFPKDNFKCLLNKKNIFTLGMKTIKNSYINLKVDKSNPSDMNIFNSWMNDFVITIKKYSKKDNNFIVYYAETEKLENLLSPYFNDTNLITNEKEMNLSEEELQELKKIINN